MPSLARSAPRSSSSVTVPGPVSALESESEPQPAQTKAAAAIASAINSARGRLCGLPSLIVPPWVAG